VRGWYRTALGAARRASPASNSPATGGVKAEYIAGTSTHGGTQRIL